MRRSGSNAEYWDRRWAQSGADGAEFSDRAIYPIRFAEMVMSDTGGRTLELGCGQGRVVRHYHGRGREITGIERSAVAVRAIKAADPNVDVRVGDATNLDLTDGEFDVLMAFGLFHNLEHDLDAAVAESARVLRAGGRFCISMRPDNVEMRLNERYWRWRQRQSAGPEQFHKWLIDPDAFISLLASHGLLTEQVEYARNMSNLYRLPMLRSRQDAAAREQDRRAGGYRLNALGRWIDTQLMRRWPEQFCNAVVFLGSRDDGNRR